MPKTGRIKTGKNVTLLVKAVEIALDTKNYFVFFSFLGNIFFKNFS